MAYSADTFVADEQPTTAKWNKLWTNDAAFNDGTGIATGAITSAKISGIDYSLATTLSNPYKFSVYRSAAQNSINGIGKINFDTELFDTNSNYDNVTNFRYVAPVAGFYFFTGMVQANGTPTTSWAPSLYKNGAVDKIGAVQNLTAYIAAGVSGFIQLAATDYVEMFLQSGGITGMNTGMSTVNFQGFLVSRT